MMISISHNQHICEELRQNMNEEGKGEVRKSEHLQRQQAGFKRSTIRAGGDGLVSKPGGPAARCRASSRILRRLLYFQELLVASLLLAVRPGAPSSFLLLVAMLGAPSSVLAPRFQLLSKPSVLDLSGACFGLPPRHAEELCWQNKGLEPKL